MPITISLNTDIEARIKKLAVETGHSESFYINQMIERQIDSIECEHAILQETEQYQADIIETYSSAEIRHELGLDN